VARSLRHPPRIQYVSKRIFNARLSLTVCPTPIEQTA
jgi:hypothetical protein